MTTRAGTIPTTLGFEAEELFLWLEDPVPGAGVFVTTPYRVEDAAVVIGSGDAIPTVRVRIGLGNVPEANYSGQLRDWQLVDASGSPTNAFRTLFRDQRRMQLRTARPEKSEDWLLIDAYIDRVVISASGGAQARTLTFSGTSVISAADRELGQFLLGQLRRSGRAQKTLLDGGDDDELVRVSAVPCVFNPGGRGNCSPYPITVGGKEVYVFTDEYDRAAVQWTIARMLRYIQFAATLSLATPATPSDPKSVYDVAAFIGVDAEWNDLRWTSIGLPHTVNYSFAPGTAGRGPNLDPMIDPHVGAEAGTTTSTASGKVLLRAPAGIGVDAMSALEAFVAVANAGGLLVTVDCDVDQQGDAKTYLRWCIRGDRSAQIVGSGGSGTEIDGTPDGAGNTTRIGVYRTTRGVHLYTASDRADSAGKSVADLYAENVHTEIDLTFDESRMRSTVVMTGEPVRYELTTGALLPGWIPDPRWDVNVSDPAAVSAAKLAVTGSSFRSLFSPPAPPYQQVGRYWVLNEDGLYWADRDVFRRQYGEWSTDAKWEPWKPRTSASIVELAVRGDGYWALRRRRFLPTLSRIADSPLPVLAQISFDAGSTWWFGQALGLTMAVDENRCAIMFTNADLSSVGDPSLPGRNYITAYIDGTLRVRAIAGVESDDAVAAWAIPPSSQELYVARGEVLRRSMPRVLAWYGEHDIPAANSLLIADPVLRGAIDVTRSNLDYQDEATRLAERARREMSVVRVTGTATIPYLWRDGANPAITGYRVGDEVLGVLTGDAALMVDFMEGRGADDPAPRIASITHRYSVGEQSTTLHIEDVSEEVRL